MWLPSTVPHRWSYLWWSDGWRAAFDLYSQLRLNVWSHSGKEASNGTLLSLNQRRPQRGKWHAGTKTDGDGSLNDPFSQTSVCWTHAHLKVAFYATKGVCMCLLLCVVSVMLSIAKLIDQFSRCWALHTLNVWGMCVCVCACLAHVSVYVVMCPTPSIFKPMGQSFPARGVEVQFADCKINMKALLAAHSACRVPKCRFLIDSHVPSSKMVWFRCYFIHHWYFSPHHQ